MVYRRESTAWGDYNDPRSNIGWKSALKSGNLASDYTQEDIEAFDVQSEFREGLSPGSEFEAYLSDEDYRSYKRKGTLGTREGQSVMSMVSGTGSEQRRINELISSGGSMEDVNKAVSRGYMGDLNWILRSKSDPNRTESEQKMATWRLQDIQKHLPKGSEEEFKSLVDAYGGVFAEGTQKQGTGNDPSYTNLNEFLNKNVMYSSSVGHYGSGSLKPRRIEGQIMEHLKTVD